MRPRSLRLRLVLWYLGVLALVLIAFSAALYLTLRAWLNETLTDSVSDRADATQALITFDASGAPQLELPVDRTDPDLGETFQRLYNLTGATMYDNTEAFGGIDPDDEAFLRALEGRRSVETVDGNEKTARVVTEPVLDDGAVAGVLQVGESTEDVDETLNGLLIIIAIAVPAALVLASSGGWWLASRALSPIDRITRTAAEIGASRDLGRRLGLDLPEDEVGRLARTFDEMIARLEAAFRRQQQFTADASHELRTPLTAVRGQIEVALERTRDPAEYQRVLAAVYEQVARMTRLVGGLLMLARADAESLELQREPVDVRELVEAVAEQVRPLADARRLALKIEAGPAVTVHADQDLLLQLVLNLADNAVKYTASGGVTLGWRSVPAGVEIVVSDTGPGIPHEHTERIFERFYRVDPTAPAGEGAGLGLAIGRWIAEAHGGSLTCQSSQKGSTFTVRLPNP